MPRSAAGYRKVWQPSGNALGKSARHSLLLEGGQAEECLAL